MISSDDRCERAQLDVKIKVELISHVPYIVARSRADTPLQYHLVQLCFHGRN